MPSMSATKMTSLICLSIPTYATLEPSGDGDIAGVDAREDGPTRHLPCLEVEEIEALFEGSVTPLLAGFSVSLL